MKLLILNEVRYLLNCTQDYFYSVLPSLNADIKLMKDTQTEPQKFYHRENKWKIAEQFGRVTALVNGPEVIKKPRKIENILKTHRQRLVLGIEYTDGTKGDYINWAWENHIGSGLLINTISEGVIVSEVIIPWAEPAALLGPWTTESIGGQLYSKFFHYKNGGSQYYNLANVKYKELQEVEYSTEFRFARKRTVTTVHDGHFLFEIFGSGLDAVEHVIFGDIVDTVTWVELNGATILGPFTRRLLSKKEVWVATNGDFALGVQTYVNTGSIIDNVYGVASDGEVYFCLCNITDYSNQIDYGNDYPELSDRISSYGNWEALPTEGTADFRRDDSITNNYAFDTDWQYFGVISSKLVACCSGGVFNVYSKGFPNSETLYYEDTYGRCTRIFLWGEEFIYAYSFYGATLLDYDTSEYLETPYCGYGTVMGGEVNCTDAIYPRIISDDGYAYDLNIVGGILENYYSSILLRVLLEEREEEYITSSEVM